MHSKYRLFKLLLIIDFLWSLILVLTTLERLKMLTFTGSFPNLKHDDFMVKKNSQKNIQIWIRNFLITGLR